MSATAPSRLRVDLSAITHNYRLFKSLTKADVAGVLKANAYGTGAREVFQTLRTEGCRQFFVATPDEGMSLRALDEDAAIMILGGVYPGAENDYLNHHLIPILNSFEELERWTRFAKERGRKLPAVVHFDTAMNRLGLGVDETERLMGDMGILHPLDIKLVMTHFACSDEKGHPLNDLQAQRFAAIAKAFPHTPKSFCNSSGLFRDKNWHYDLVRPGFALYGGNPTPETENPVRSVVGLSVRILQTRLGIKGSSAGYGASHVFEKDTRLATVALGYADGFVRSGSNRAKLYWNGQPCPIMGRVSMDLIIVDISDLIGPEPQAGDWLEVLGPSQSVDALAADCGTIGYEILTQLSHRAHRIYLH